MCDLNSIKWTQVIISIIVINNSRCVVKEVESCSEDVSEVTAGQAITAEVIDTRKHSSIKNCEPGPAG